MQGAEVLTKDGSSARARRAARDLLIKALYQWQIADNDLAQLNEQFEATPEFSRVDKAYFRELLARVLELASELDVAIEGHADRDLKTVDAISRAILLLGAAELKSRPDVPTKVVINEAVELAKRYGPPDCHRFVNAVLDRASRTLAAEPGKAGSS
jgi:transcription antitermination protein NusB